jgi:uncharacterized protein (TIGR02680 family)
MRALGRFQLIRAGLINLYQYGDQVFELADGRLLLRGHNTSGKTKALELLLPFCLDGDITPRKLDPFAKAAKEMKWNLVGCVDADQRVGYAWLEFARHDGDRRAYVTVGIGMKANRNRDGVRRWFFVLPGRRVGHDLELCRGEHPLSRRELAASLADGEQLLDGPREYRRALNEAVFGFPSDEQYLTMLNLLLELRRPHLSRGLGHAEVTRLLTASLPEVDHELMRRLGEGLEQLDELQAALERLELARERVERFHVNAYRPYAQAAVTARGRALRAAEGGHERASSTLRAAQAEGESAQAAVAETIAALAAAKARALEAEGEVSALVGSSAWRAVEAVDQLAQTAARAGQAALAARDRATDAAGRLAADEADKVVAEAVVADQDERVAALARELAALAESAGFGARHAVLDDQLADAASDPRRWEDVARDAIDGWSATLAEHERLVAAVSAAEAEHERRREHADQAAARARRAADARREAESALAAERERLEEELDSWLTGLRELELPDPVRATVVERALDGERPYELWAPTAAERTAALARGRAEREEQLRTIDERLEALRDERDRLERHEDRPPQPLPTRPGDRTGRPGAPFWALVDFADAVGAAERAGLEAALQGAGLLDAWVLPDGGLLDRETLDVVLRPEPEPLAGATLADVLRPEPDQPVAAAVVCALLGSMAVGDHADAPCTIMADGRFRLGPASGRFAKPAAEHIGAGARAAARARRIAELDTGIATEEAARAGIAGELERLAERALRLAAEQASFPDVRSAGALLERVTVAVAHESDLRAEHDELQAAARDAADRADWSRHDRDQHATAAGLPSGLDESAVRRHREAAVAYRRASGHVVAAVLDVRAARRQLAALDERLEHGRAAAAEYDTAARRAEDEARRLDAEAREARAALGRDGADLRSRKDAAERRRDDARARIEELHAQEGTQREQARDLAAACERANRELEVARDARHAALDAFRRLDTGGLLVLALGDDAPGDHRDAAGWTLTRALEVARGLPDAASRTSLAELANRVQRECSRLDQDLAQYGDYGVVTQLADDLLVVQVTEGPREHALVRLMERLDEELDHRRRALSAEQRRVFSDALLEEIADHLRRRIEAVTDLVADMNATLAGCPTGSGKVVELAWRPREDGDLRELMRLLRRSLPTLAEPERERLVTFFRDRVETAREEAAGAGVSAGGVSAHLRTAFDYRDWFAFDLIEVHDGQRIRLTARRHAVGSGGEQAVLVHLPLFAAAAALYDSSRDAAAPRPVMLDEALSGIDDRTRERVMHALVQLDLDVVMTSHELWGTYRTVPALAIYQLHRDNDLFGVFAERFLWDGEVLHEGPQTALL